MPHQYYPIAAPGMRGLNTQEKGIQDPRYLRSCQNVMINTTGLLGNRPEMKQDITSPAFSLNQQFHYFHEWIQSDGTSTILGNCTGIGGGTFDSITDPTNNLVDGSVSIVNPWKMQTLNGTTVIAATDGQQLASYTGTTFATITASSGTVPTSSNGIMLTAYGRVWALQDNNQVIAFSALGDETHWSTGAGTIDMRSIWTQGMDVVTAICAYNGGLVVFGEKHIVFWVDGTGNQLGIDPDNLYVSEVVEGTGCLHQHSLQQLPDGDYIFLSRHGLQQLSRAFVADQNYAINNLTYLIREDFNAVFGDVQPEDDNISAAVDPVRGLYVIIHYNGSATKIYVLQFSHPFIEERSRQKLYPIFEWYSAHASSSLWEPSAVGWDDANQRLLFGCGYEIFSFDVAANGDWTGSDGHTSNTSWAYTSYFSPGEVGLLKSIDQHWIVLALSATISPTFQTDFDYDTQFAFTGLKKTPTMTANSGRATTRLASMGGRGQMVSIGMSYTLNTTAVWGIQNWDIWAKLGGPVRAQVTQ